MCKTYFDDYSGIWTPDLYLGTVQHNHRAQQYLFIPGHYRKDQHKNKV